MLAIASSPKVDPAPLAAVNQDQVPAARNAWESLLADPNRPLVRRATEGLYPPGSTFKVITSSAGLESGVVAPDTVFEDDGSIDIDGHTIVEANRPEHSVSSWTLTEGFAYSLNVVFAQVGLQIGAQTLVERAKAFGIGSTVPFDESVSSGQIASTADFLDSPAALANTTAFGQGELLVTPMHMAMVVSAIANAGTAARPYLVQSLRDQNGKRFPRQTPVTRFAVDQQTADIVQGFMVDAVEWGYATAADAPGIPSRRQNGNN